MATFNFTTGQTSLPDIGELSYNGCTFGPYFATEVSGRAIKDAAERTVKYVEWTLTVEGYVTLDKAALVGQSIDNQMQTMLLLLNQPAGQLVYTGRGFANFVINNVSAGKGASGYVDVAWGPMPDVLEFQPLGGGLSAKVKWTVVVRTTVLPASGKRPVLQFNEEVSIKYGDDGYSKISIKGTMEIAETRLSVNNRTVQYSADDYRTAYLRRYASDDGTSGIDLRYFRVTGREFNVSRDKRTMEWSFTAEEHSAMPMPAECTLARGTYTVEPTTRGPALIQWFCTLTGTYTVSKLTPQRVAWSAFFAMLQWRMSQSCLGVVPAQAQPNNQQNVPDITAWSLFRQFVLAGGGGAPGIFGFGGDLIAIRRANALRAQLAAPNNDRRAWLVSFRVQEWLYLDSKQITFSATWILVTTFAGILQASGIWTTPPDLTARNWASFALPISADRSWLRNRVNANQDLIVDFGGGSR